MYLEIVKIAEREPGKLLKLLDRKKLFSIPWLIASNYIWDEFPTMLGQFKKASNHIKNEEVK